MPITLAEDICLVRLRNQETFILKDDGWNPGEERKCYGPLWSETADIWTLNVNEIIAYRELNILEKNSFYHRVWDGPSHPVLDKVRNLFWEFK